MAVYNDTPQSEDLQKALSGLNYLVNGSEGNTASLAKAPVAGLKSMVHILGQGLDKNARARPKSGGADNVTAADLNGQIPPRDKLKDIAGRLRDGSLSPVETNALKSAMYFAGYDIDFGSDSFSTNELVEFASFNTEYINTDDAKLTTLRETNLRLDAGSAEMQGAIDQAITNVQEKEAARIAEEAARDAAKIAEAAALEQSLNSRLESVLVYTGYLKPENVGDDYERVAATRELLRDHQWDVIDENNDLNGVLRSMYGIDNNNQNTANITQDGLERVLTLTKDAMVPSRLQGDLESENPQLISIAQNYLITEGYSDLKADGVVRADTVTAAQDLLSKPQAIPKGIYLDDGEVDYNKVMQMADSGQLLIPSDSDIGKYLEDFEEDIWKQLPTEAERTPDDIMSREEYAAYVMLDNSDGTAATYQKFLDDYNAAHAGMKLDVVAELPVVDPNAELEGLPVYTTVALTDAAKTLDLNDDREAANNSLGFEAPDAEVLGDMPLVGGAQMNNAAVAKTETDLLVYNGPDVAMNEFASILKQSAEPVSMDQVIYAYQSMKTSSADLVNGANSGTSQMPAPGIGNRISMLLGDEPGTVYDMANPADLEKALKGAAGYEYMDEVALNSFLTSDHKGLNAALESAQYVAQGTPRLTNDTLIADEGGDIEDLDVEAAYANAENSADPLAPSSVQPASSPAKVDIKDAPVIPVGFGFPLSSLTQSEIKLSVPNGDGPKQSLCSASFNGCAIGAPMSLREINPAGLPTMGNNLGSISSPNIRVFDPMGGN